MFLDHTHRLCCVVVCDLETSRMGAPYIYDISRLRVNYWNKLKVNSASFWFLLHGQFLSLTLCRFPCRISVRPTQAATLFFWVTLWLPTRIRACRTEIDFFIPCGAYIGPAAWQTAFHKLSLTLLRVAGSPQREELWGSFPITQILPRDSSPLECKTVRNVTLRL